MFESPMSSIKIEWDKFGVNSGWDVRHSSHSLKKHNPFVSLYCTVIRAYNWRTDQKSVNLEYNTLVGWADWTDVLSTKRLMFRVFFFFIKSCKILCKNPFNLYFFYKITKMKTNSFEYPNSIRNYEKKNTWNVKRLVDNSFVPLAHRTSELYSRLTAFNTLQLKIPTFEMCC